MEGIIEAETAEGEADAAVLFYAMGFRHSPRLPAPPIDVLWRMQRLLRIAPLVVASGEALEVLLIGNRAHTATAWAAEGLVAHLMRVQTAFVVPPEQGTACVARLIQKHRLLRPPTTTDNDGVALDTLLDAYRIVSDGRMHPLDTLEWCMATPALERMREEACALEAELQAHAREANEVSALVERAQVVLETARTIMRWQVEEEAEHRPAPTVRVWLHHGRSWVMEQQEWELRVLEDREMELLHATELKRAQLGDLCTVLHRQATLHAQRRARWDTAAEASTSSSSSSSSPPRKRRKNAASGAV